MQRRHLGLQALNVTQAFLQDGRAVTLCGHTLSLQTGHQHNACSQPEPWLPRWTYSGSSLSTSKPGHPSQQPLVAAKRHCNVHVSVRYQHLAAGTADEGCTAGVAVAVASQNVVSWSHAVVSDVLA